MANIGYLQVTRQCNQTCVFCSNPENNNRLTFEDAQKAVLKLKEENFDGVILTGGEPTLYEQLEPLIGFCDKVGIAPRLITNGQKLADKDYFRSLVDVGLKHIHVSIHSYNAEIQSRLTHTEHSLKNIQKTLAHCASFGVSVDVNTVINRYNSDHLHKTVIWIVKNYPIVTHFIWNNLDPHMNRVQENPNTVPRFREFEISLTKALAYLSRMNRTFRVERVPLCYMAEHAWASTETRKIVKAEKRDIYFLDKRNRHRQDNFFYEKCQTCDDCSLSSICAGVYLGDSYYSFDDVYPLFLDKDKIVNAIIEPQKT